MENKAVKKVSRLKSAIPQVLAVSAQNLILFDMGLCFGFPTIIVPAVQNSPGALSMNDEQTSWLGSISMIFSPVGSLLSGIFADRLGRKMSMMLVNLPFLLSWVLFYFVNSQAGLLISSVIMGLGMGLVEAPILTYVAEVSQPQLRGMLTSFSELWQYVGIFCVYLVGTLTDWRTTAAISAALPVFSIVALSQVPESPAWLMSRGRTKEAERSLCWLRGWVEPAAIQAELLELKHYYQKEEGSVGRVLANEGCSAEHGSEVEVSFSTAQGSSDQKVVESGNTQNYDNALVNLKAMLKLETMRPLIMVTMLSFLEHWSGMSGTRPYMVQVFDAFGMPIDAHWATVVTSLIAIFGVVACLVAVPWCGKRPLVFLSVAGVVMCCILLGTYAYLALPGGKADTAWMPLALFIIMFLTHSLALNTMPWMLMSEIFPFRTRSLATGIAGALNYFFAFVASKTFLDLKASLGLHGVLWLYAALTALGSVYLMFEFKETEGKSLQDIEDYYKKRPVLPFGKLRTAPSHIQVVGDVTADAGNVRFYEVQKAKSRKRDTAGELSASALLKLYSEEIQHCGGGMDLYYEDKCLVTETKDPKVNGDGSSSTTGIPSEQSVTVQRKEVRPSATSETAREYSVNHDSEREEK